MVGFQQAEARLQILPEIGNFCRAGFGADYDLLPPVVEGGSQFGLAVGVEAGGVEIVHSVRQRLLQQVDGILFTDALDRQRAETVFWNLNLCTS